MSTSDPVDESPASTTNIADIDEDGPEPTTSTAASGAGAVVAYGENEEDDDGFDFNDIFSTRRPKDFAAGMGSGMKSIAKGVAAGAASLMAAPVMGAQKEGVKGFAKGVGAGLLGAVVFPVWGTGVGVTQMVRGVLNTPEAMAEEKLGKQWDAKERKWITYNLEDASKAITSTDDEDILGPARARTAANGTKSGGGASRTGPVDMTYYEALGVTPDATSGEIKKAYYLLARKLHPDKNPDDAEAGQKFQKVGEAYQVLGNDDLRAKYDEHGASAVENNNFLDNGTFFTMLFGNEKFEHLVGRLSLAMLTSSGVDLTDAESATIQERRQTRLAVKLANMVQPFVDGEKEEFHKLMTAHAKELAEESFGEDMLHTIGYIYANQAEQALGSIGAKWLSRGHALKTKFNVVGSAWKMYRQMRATSKVEEADDAAKAEAEKEMLPLFLEAVWSVTLIDIENTSKEVCLKVLADVSQGQEVRQVRAEALLALGNIFMAAKSESGVKDFMKVMEDAMRNAATKGDEA